MNWRHFAFGLLLGGLLGGLIHWGFTNTAVVAQENSCAQCTNDSSDFSCAQAEAFENMDGQSRQMPAAQDSFDTAAKKSYKSPEQSLRRIKKVEENISEVLSERDQETFLKNVEYGDLFKNLDQKVGISQKQFNMLVGKFVGEVRHFDKNKLVWGVEMTFEPMGDKPLHAKTSMKLSKDGEVFSNSTGSGLVNDKGRHHSLGKGTKAVLIEVGGGRGFFQLYQMRTGELIGNYYEFKDHKTLSPVGRVHMEPVN